MHILSRFTHAPRQPHLDAAHRVLRYLKQTPGQGIFLSSSSALEIQAFLVQIGQVAQRSVDRLHATTPC